MDGRDSGLFVFLGVAGTAIALAISFSIAERGRHTGRSLGFCEAKGYMNGSPVRNGHMCWTPQFFSTEK